MGPVGEATPANMAIGDSVRPCSARSCRVWVLSRAMAVGFFTAISLMIVISGSTPAAAQAMQGLLDRIDRLERDIRTLNIQLARGAAPASLESGENAVTVGGSEITGAAVARFDTRMTSIEADVRGVTGSVEELDFRIRTIEGQLDKIISDLNFRLSELEQGRSPSMNQGLAQGQTQGEIPGQEIMSVPSTGTVTQDVGQAGSGVLGTITESELQKMSSASQTTADTGGTQPAIQSTLPTQSVAGAQGVTAEPVGDAAAPEEVQKAGLTPKEQYTNAFGLLRQAKYEDAAVALQAFIAQNPDDPLTPNARYWLGETYYVRAEFVRAAEVFFEGYKLAPTAAKAPDTLLKLGMALGNLGKKAEACAAFGKLSEEFPNASGNVRTTLERERLRNGC